MTTVIWAGLASGAILVLTALGYNIVFVSAGVFNFAQAQFVMLGTFIAYWSAVQLQLPAWAGFFIGAAIGFVLGGVEEVLAIRPVVGKGVQTELVTTVGVGIILDGVAYVIWGSQPLAVPSVASLNPVTIFGGSVQPNDIVLIVAAILIPALLSLWSRFSLAGMISRSLSEDRVAATIRGVSVSTFSLAAFALAAGFAGMLGPLIGPKTYAIYSLGDQLAILAFVALAIGGFGSYFGAMVGGFLIGIVESVSARYMNASSGDLLVFALLLVVLLIRPSGLFRTMQTRRI